MPFIIFKSRLLTDADYNESRYVCSAITGLVPGYNICVISQYRLLIWLQFGLDLRYGNTSIKNESRIPFNVLQQNLKMLPVLQLQSKLVNVLQQFSFPALLISQSRECRHVQRRSDEKMLCHAMLGMLIFFQNSKTRKQQQQQLFISHFLNTIKYLGIMIDSNLSWKSQISCISKKIKRSIGILSKLRYYVDLSILIKLYYALIYPFLIYGIITWGNTYPTTIQPLSVLQKKEVRIMTFSKFDEHSSPLFKKLNIIKLSDLIKYHISIFMFKFHNQLLPSVFNSYFTSVENIHSYNTRATATHYPRTKKCSKTS